MAVPFPLLNGNKCLELAVIQMIWYLLGVKMEELTILVPFRILWKIISDNNFREDFKVRDKRKALKTPDYDS